MGLDLYKLQGTVSIEGLDRSVQSMERLDADAKKTAKSLDGASSSAKRLSRDLDSVSSSGGATRKLLGGLNDELSNLLSRIPLIGQPLSRVARELTSLGEDNGIKKIEKDAQRATATLGTLQAQAAKLRQQIADRRSDFAEGLRINFGGRVDTDFLKRFRGAKDEVEKIELLMSKGFSSEFVAKTERAAHQLTKIERSASQALTAVDGRVRAAEQSLEAFNARAGQTEGVLSRVAAAAGGPLRLGLLAAAAATVAVAAGAFALANHAAEAGSKVHDLNQRTGVSVELLSSMRLAAQQSNTSLDEFATGVSKFNKLIGQAAEGNKKAAATLKAFGIEPMAALKNQEAALSKVFQVINALPPGIMRSVAAQEAFGRSGDRLVDLIQTVGGNFEEFKRKAQELGLVMTKESARAADEFGDTLAELKTQVSEIAREVGQVLLPTVLSAMQNISAALKTNAADWGEWASAVRMAKTAGILTGAAPPPATGVADYFFPGDKAKAGGAGVGQAVTGSVGATNAIWSGFFDRTKDKEKGRKGSGGGGGESPALKAARIELDALRIVEEGLQRSYQRRTRDEEFYHQNSLKSLDSFVGMRKTLEREMRDSLLKVADGELTVARLTKGTAQERANAVAKAQDRITQIWEQYQENVTKIDRDAHVARREAEKSAWGGKIALLEETASGFAEIYRRMADEGVMSFASAQRRIAGEQLEILLAQQKGIERQLKGVSSESLLGKELLAQLDVMRQRVANYRALMGRDEDQANRRDRQRVLDHAEQLRAVYESIIDMQMETADARLSSIERSTTDVLRAERSRLDFELKAEDLRARRTRQSLELQIANEKLKVQAAEHTAAVIEALNAKIVASDQAAAARRSQIVEDFLQLQRDKLRQIADTIADPISDSIRNGFEDGWRGALSGFRQLLDDMQRETMRAEVFKSLRALFNLRTAEESPDGKAGTGPSNPLLASLAKALGINSLANENPQLTVNTQAITTNTSETARNTQALQQLASTMAQGGGAAASGASVDALFTRPRRVSAQDTPGAVRAAGQEAVVAVGGAGEAMAGAIGKAGNSTTKAVVSSGQAIVGALANVASVIAAGQGRGSFWKGLLLSAATGAINGAVGAWFNKDSGGSQGGLGSAMAGKFAGGGAVSGPGTGTSDSILARLSDGEFVMRASAVRRLGVPALEYMNAVGRLPRFSEGGAVSAYPAYVPAPPHGAGGGGHSRGGDRHYHITQHVTATGDQNQARRTGRQLARATRQALEQYAE